ncbi:urease accessory protein UreF [Silicimonas algicola]|uniref:Urease accessory protein UreF n=1 Tax=Silicimonas algicola TaxID=1826607 RepID=A0A316G612_9RHOB|nr:urease accessory protein UreF [Silicimonas algicola]AZQ68873.1 urease accessory protein UreF [Silicimonas algicola]PWK56032.1 urease accessory protein [Silicimonas algicola]
MTRDLLTLAQWLSPAFPVGAFAYSQGLEVAIRDGHIADAKGLTLWVEDVLDHGAGRSDAILLAAAWRGEDVDEVARAFQPTAERLRETERMGEAFSRTVRAVWGLGVADAPYPVVVGRAAALRGIAVEDTAALYLHAAAATLVSVAVRLVPLGQTEGQAVLASVTPLCERIAREAANSTLDDLSSSTFLADIASMRHETLEPRIFQS